MMEINSPEFRAYKPTDVRDALAKGDAVVKTKNIIFFYSDRIKAMEAFHRMSRAAVGEDFVTQRLQDEYGNLGIGVRSPEDQETVFRVLLFGVPLEQVINPW